MNIDILIFILVFIVICGVYILTKRAKERDAFNARVMDLDRQRQQKNETQLRSRETQGTARESRAFERSLAAGGVWSRLIHKINYKSAEETQKIRDTFRMAGWQSENSLLIYGLAKIVIIFPAGFLIWIYAHYYAEWVLMHKFAAVVFAALVSSYAVDWFVKYSVQRRQSAITRAFPDALDLMVICSEAGLSLNAIIQRVSNDIAQIHPDLGHEMGLLAIELNMLSSRKEALDNFSRRLQSQICKNIVSSLLQAEQYGTPISQTMKTLSEEFRFDRLMTAEQRAAKLPVLMAGPLVLFIFPSLFIVILGPAIINVLDKMG